MSNPSDELPDVKSIDRLIHEPVRLLIMANLYVADTADFIYLMNQLNLTFGNLSSHMSKLEEAGYINVEKEFQDKKPVTKLSLTDLGREAFEDYRQRMKHLFI
ncbi:transcriptional regulator [Candidatus Bathyarchaeota archaeon]|nr:MAG: transcriptional regulator [Candidatus Bathyarchaeota archaeon]